MERRQPDLLKEGRERKKKKRLTTEELCDNVRVVELTLATTLMTMRAALSLVNEAVQRRRKTIKRRKRRDTETRDKK